MNRPEHVGVVQTNPPRTVYDASGLPTVTFDHHNVNWWGTLAFIVIEGTTLVIAITAYLYVRKNFDAWPPPPTPLPDLLIPTINLLLLLAVIIPMRWADKAARRLDLQGVRVGLWIAVGMTLVCVVLRGFEFAALNTRWDSHVYGSVAWGVLALHSALLAIDLIETGSFVALTYIGPFKEKLFPDVSDAAFYQYFLSLSYIVVYAVLFLTPRFL